MQNLNLEQQQTVGKSDHPHGAEDVTLSIFTCPLSMEYLQICLVLECTYLSVHD